jgi:SRSO17 transposase
MVTFSHIFRRGHRDFSDNVRGYLHGLLASDLRRKNPDRMEERLPAVRADALRHLLSGSPWDYGEAMRLVCVGADDLLGGREDSALVLDECGFVKKGTKSAGVARQYIGRLGKVDNCQMGVFGALSSGQWAQLVGMRLYLPESWTASPARCKAAGIPRQAGVLRTKHDLALEIVKEARANGARFGWVLGDAFYGKSPAFLDAVEDLGLQFVIDLHCDTHVYTQHPRPGVPPPTGRRGRKPHRPKTDQAACRVDAIAAQLAADRWETVTVRSSTKGPITVQAAAVPIWTWDGRSSTVRERVLLVQRAGDPKEWEYTYSLAVVRTAQPTEELVRRQRQRFWIERTFEDGKSNCGMADYQVRTWRGWHHHMTLVAMAMLFVLTERVADAFVDQAPSDQPPTTAPTHATAEEEPARGAPSEAQDPSTTERERAGSPGRTAATAPGQASALRPSMAALVPFDTVGLTVADVMHVLMVYLPRRDTTEEEVFRALAKRHAARRAAVGSASTRTAGAERRHCVAK